MKTVQTTRYGIALFSAAMLMFASCQSAPRQAEQAAAGEESLLDLIAGGKTAEVRQRFSSSDSVNQKNARGQSLLHIAALRNDSEMIQFLLSMKADPAVKDSAGETPLAAALGAGCYDAARVLADADSSIFAENAAGSSVWKIAASRGTEAVEPILNEKTVLQQDKRGRTVLHYAVESRDETLVKAVLAKKANPGHADASGTTPLALAYADPVAGESARIAAELILAGAEPLRGDFSYFETAVLKRNPGMRFEEGKTPLHIAAGNGYAGFVNYLLERKVPVNVKDIASSTPLHEAVRNGRIETARILLASGADPNPRDSSGNTPLHLVMPLASRSQLFTLLLGAGANPNLKDSYGETPLHIAARLGMSEDIIRALLNAGADTNERNKKGITPLALAIERNQLVQANLFVRLGADIHAEDMDGHTALSKAISSGPEMVEAVIVETNVQTRDSQGRTPLHIAVLNKAPEPIINYLISRKADINARDKNGDSPLHIAVRGNDRASGEILLAYGGDVFNPNVSGESALKIALARMGGRQDWVLNSAVIKSTDGAGNTPLHLAAEWQLAQVVTFIGEKGGDLDARNANGETPLFSAVKADSSETLRTMLSPSAERRADINARDFLGNSALHACIRWSAPRAAEALLDYDARSNSKRLINARNLAGKTALHEAARTGNLAFLRTLLAAGADINAADESGRTALTDAIKANREDAIRLLLDRKASPVIQDMYGRNALHEAVDNSSPEIVALLRASGGNAMSRDSYGKTPLSLALKKTSATMTAVIGKDTNMVDSDGNTPLHIAVSEHSGPESLETLLASGFPVNNRNRTGSTALLQAVRGGQESLAKVLLTAGADPYASDNQGESAVTIALAAYPALVPMIAEYAPDKTDTIGDGLLHYAARSGDAETVRRLLALPKIDRGARNISGETAYDIAVRWQRPEIAALLK